MGLVDAFITISLLAIQITLSDNPCPCNRVFNVTFSEWIDLKTPQTLHIVLGKGIGAIRMWKHRGIIAREFWPDIMSAFPEIGLRDLLEMEAASKAAK